MWSLRFCHSLFHLYRTVSFSLLLTAKKLVINHSDQEVTALPEGLIAELQLKGKGSKARRHGVEVAVHKH